ncbi:hypothetical protein CC1G_08714 [Coprinopsis cinerea okayama7|uniref:Ribonuclease H1 N-terminal domain-containing protein n=1 Tax=Coprinopsis cinerea (strain Okayama-7 / 130 / ATCC MYA-4618 / FGSC 9003) TaxID=240176 RepID=A8NIW0_COPC7|nr:hypothetical protein CC1G_08714 [Coprinopsis cinerea okayama7\|eukprot:XP_001834083.1 hypothetical protein CC1G_08714 [Coprinopsis cinerea okayama7\
MSSELAGTVLPHTNMPVDQSRVAPGRVVGRAPNPVDPTNDVVTVHCEGCNSLVTVAVEHRTYYCVFRGRSVGVFVDPNVVNAQVEGVSNGFRLKFPSKEAAFEAFKNALAEGKVEIIL